MKKRIISSLLALVMLLSLTTAVFADEVKYTVTEPDGQGIIYVNNQGGKTLGYSADSGVKLIEADGYAFKDLNKNGKLDKYEDWRLSDNERATDLANLMVADGRSGIEAISGLMLYSSHTAVNAPEISASTTTALTKEHLRAVLVTTIKSPEIAATWSNNVQKYAESVEYGIPANNSSDPRHSVGSSNVEYYVDSQGALSQWPSSIGLAATFDVDAVKLAGKIQSTEYRALGIATALGPQIDTASDPRWSRFNGTFGEDEALGTDLTRAYVDGFQTTYAADGTPIGWGMESANAMVKHWPGGGAGEGGRDAHYNYGKFSVFPGGNLQAHINIFVNGAFALEDGTGAASAVMPYYTISYNQDPTGANVGNSYSKYMITDLLRGEYGFDGVVCTDWNIVYDVGSPYSFGGMCWGMENVHITDRFVRLISTGVNQFGGVNAIENIMFAYDKSVADSGQTVTDAMWAESGRILIKNILQTGLFENPYLDIETTKSVVGNPGFMASGYEVQQKSVVMVKNTANLINAEGVQGKIYTANANNLNDTAFATLSSNYFGDQLTTDINEAKTVFITINAPTGGGYDSKDFTAGGNGYVPMVLQYAPYTATTARAHSIASNPSVYWEKYGYDVENRSYKDKTTTVASLVTAINNYNTIVAAAKEAGAKVITYVRASNPLVFTELEPSADAIFVGYSISTQAVLDAVAGKYEPSGMLPAQQPANMEVVEAQLEDTAHDMECYVDANGNKYDFGFGLNYSGIIGVDSKDARYDKYVAGNDATAAIIKGTLTEAKCGEGETATFDVVYDGVADLSSVRFQLSSEEFDIVDVTSEYDFEFNPANDKVIVYDANEGIQAGDVIATVTVSTDVTPWLTNSHYFVQIHVIQATNADAEICKVAGASGVVVIKNEFLLGDVNCDGVVSNADIVLIARYLVDLETLSDQALLNADVNQDGEVNNVDCVLIARMLVD